MPFSLRIENSCAQHKRNEEHPAQLQITHVTHGMKTLPLPKASLCEKALRHKESIKKLLLSEVLNRISCISWCPGVLVTLWQYFLRFA
jgi:hypothetical protein